MYEQYNRASEEIRQNLIAKKASLSVLYSFERSIRECKAFLMELNVEYSVYLASEWCKKILKLYDERTAKSLRHFQYLIALRISPEETKKPIFYPYVTDHYSRCPKWAIHVINKYDSYCPKRLQNYYLKQSVDLLCYLNNLGCKSFEEIDCTVIFNYRIRGHQNCITNFLTYLHEHRLIDKYVLGAYSLPNIHKLANFKQTIQKLPQTSIPFSTYEKAKDKYIKSLIEEKYSKTVVNEAIHYGFEFALIMKIYNFNYSYKAVEFFVEYQINELNCSKRFSKSVLKILKSIGMIIENKVPPKVLMPENNKIPSWFMPYYLSYRNYRIENRMQESTLNMDRSTLLRFTQFLTFKGINCLDKITRNLIMEYFVQDAHSTNEGKQAMMIKLRLFLEFLEDEELITTQLSKSIPIVNTTKTRPTESIDENTYNLILNKCKEWEDNGEYLKPLIIKIELYTALRPSDIMLLKKENIDFHNKEFKICQQKTNNPVVIPFPNEIGNLLFEYMTKQRPNVENEHIFIVNQAPYTHITRCFFRRTLIDASAGLVTKTHLLRKTFATRMLKNHSTVTQISNALGHVSNDIVDPYIDTDIASMRLCGLSLSSLN